MMKKPPKHDHQYDEAIRVAENDFRSADGLELTKKCPYLFSSNNADAYWITAHCLYLSGHAPLLLHKSRGYRWDVYVSGHGFFVAEVKRPDHRNGITVIYDQCDVH